MKKTEYVIRMENGRLFPGIRDATGRYTHVFDSLARAKIALSILQRGGKTGRIVRAKQDRYNPRRQKAKYRVRKNFKKYSKRRKISHLRKSRRSKR